MENENKESEVGKETQLHSSTMQRKIHAALTHGSLKKYASLICLMMQNALLVLVMRYSRTRKVDDMYLTTSSVVMAEIVKFITCNLIIFFQEKSVTKWFQHLNENIFQQPMDCLKIAVPSLVYTFQNNLLFVAVSNLDAAVFQVSYQLKILTTALFSVAMLRKELTRMQWFALLILFVGVSFVQLPSGGAKPVATGPAQSPLIGMLAVLTSCVMSGFAGVYFEKILKGTKQSLWVRNIQLGFIGMIIGTITMMVKDGGTVREKGLFLGYDWIVWFVIAMNSLGGLMVAVVVKYADNILKGFATSGAIILSSIASIFIFDFTLSMTFTIGATFVISAVYLYGKYVPKPKVDPVNMKV